MRHLTVNLDHPVLHLFPISDVQVGAHGVAKDEFREHIESAIADPYARFLGVGDYCVTPETAVLTADLRWVPAGSLEVGDEIVGFEDERPGVGQRRRFKFGVVTKAGRRILPVYRLTLSDGRTLEATGNHRWIASVSGKTELDWMRTDDIVRRLERGLASVRMIALLPKQEFVDNYASGFLAAAFDGEGYFGGLANGGLRLGYSQRENAMMAQTRTLLDDLGFRHSSRPASAEGVTDLRLVGSTSALLTFMQAVRPPRLLAKWRENNLLEQLTLRRQAALPSPVVVAAEFLGEREVAALTSSTGTYIAEGFGSHNTDGMSPSNRRNLLVSFVKGELYDTARDMLDDAAAQQRDEFLRLVAGSEGRWDALLKGHHLWEYVRAYADGTKQLRTTDHDIADALGAPYLGEPGQTIGSAMITYRFPATHKGGKRPLLRVYAVHGQGGGSTFAGPLNQLERMMRAFTAHVYIVAHHHKDVAAAANRLDEDPKAPTHLVATDTRLVSAGSWMRGYMPNEVTYAEDGMMVPLAIGAPIIYVKPKKRGAFRVRALV